MRLRVNRDQVLPRLLFELLRDHRVRKRVIATANLSNQASINQFGLNPIPVSLPPGAEQENIVNQMLVHEQSLIVSESELKKLREFKSGITSDLLTGRVPVTKDMNAEHRIAR
jgi:restriction endonuclease S subunit